MEYTEAMKQKLEELIRFNIPDPGRAPTDNTFLLLLADMLRRIEALEAETFPAPPAPPVEPGEEEEEEA